MQASDRLDNYPFALQSELRDAANEHGYRVGPEQAAGWLFFRSASAPGEIALAATQDGLAGPFFLSISHPGAARELAAEAASPCAKGHVAAFAFETRAALFAAVGEVYRLSISLPTFPFEDFVRETAHLGDTEEEQMQKVRIGQARFRDALMNYWNGTCPLTGISNPELLRASHIIGWAKCDSDQERLNVYNGFLLSSLWDAAFDSGLVTFDDHGRAVASPLLDDKAAAEMGIGTVPPLALTNDHRSRLSWHRINCWQG